MFIPPLWWHHVESLEPFNVLVNYWWHDRVGDGAWRIQPSMHCCTDFEHSCAAGLNRGRLRAHSSERYLLGHHSDSTEHIPPEQDTASSGSSVARAST